MKKIALILLVAISAFAIYWFQFRSSATPEGPKQQALTVKRHSAAFNTSIDSLLQAYFKIKDAFVDADSVKAKQADIDFMAFISRLNLEELKKDTAGIYETATGFVTDIRANAESLGKQQTITEMRQDFKGISDIIYPFLKTIHYEGGKLYWQNCPMAFGENNAANWISNTEEVVNPYLGKNHPEYKATMLHCGEIKDTIKAQ